MTRFVWLLVAGMVVGLAWLSVRSPHPPRNLLLIGIDTLRPDHTSAYGYAKRTTPNLEAIAARGVRFEDATSHAPWTLPSVSTVLTSQYPSEHGAGLFGEERNLAEDVPARLGDVESLATILSRHGLRTQAISANAFTGYGIEDHFDGFSYAHRPADLITEEALGFLREAKDQPFALYLHYADPHEHHRLPPPRHRARFVEPEILEAMAGRKEAPYRYIHDRFGWAFYDAQTSFADEQIGLVLRELRRLGLDDETLVVVYSDHGEELWEHADAHREYGTDPRGYHGIGHGQSLYQELLSVVLLMAGGGLPEGRSVIGPVGLRDLAPTILEVMGFPAGETMEGSSLLPAIRKGEATGGEVFSESIAYGHEKKALRRGDWKYIRSWPGPKEELYDLADDPGETVNLVAREESRRADMSRRVDEILDGFPVRRVEVHTIDEATRRNLRALGYLTDGPADKTLQPAPERSSGD